MSSKLLLQQFQIHTLCEKLLINADIRNWVLEYKQIKMGCIMEQMWAKNMTYYNNKYAYSIV
jgi:hypothetical protein